MSSNFQIHDFQFLMCSPVLRLVSLKKINIVNLERKNVKEFKKKSVRIYTINPGKFLALNFF